MDLEQNLFSICEPVLARSGYELIWVQVSGAGGSRKKVALYIDTKKGVNVEDCATASRLIGPVIEDSGLFDLAYVLEVSSPGLDRPLFKPADYERFAGSKARIMLRQAVEGRRNFTGILRGLENGSRMLLELEGGGIERLALDNVHRANLVYEWK
ncbi:MAG TPA: ribosome maturation factor RimP [Candidatus Glassbacteria bacterium]|nr:ribosome maturation factor RimP [Candidatus Glassbacteria bacterium]